MTTPDTFTAADMDLIDLSALLTNYGPAADLRKFVQVSQSGADTLLKVDKLGTGAFDMPHETVTLTGITSLNGSPVTLDLLLNNNRLVL